MCELWTGGPVFAPDPAFPVGTDSVLLADFANKGSPDAACELGCGAGLGLVLLCKARERLRVTGVEIRAEAAELARRNMAANGFSERACILTGDLRRHRELIARERFDLVLCNPPYFAEGSGKLSPDPARAASRSEQSCTLADVCAAAAWALQNGGAFCIVHKPERLSEVLCSMSAAGIEPKRLRTVQRHAETPPSLVLIEGKRGAKPGLRMEAPLLLCKPNGGDSDELRAIYHME